MQRLRPLLLLTCVVALTSCSAKLPPITEEYMQDLGQRAASGDRTAMQSILDVHHRLYDGIDWNDNSLLCDNCALMEAAFTPIGESAARGSQSAMDALKLFVGKRDIRVFTADPLGVAAAAGEEEALSLLLDYEKTGFLESTVVSALVPAASSNVPKAVGFMLHVLEDPTANAIRHFAISGLRGAAKAGNKKAGAALLRHINTKGRSANKVLEDIGTNAPNSQH